MPDRSYFLGCPTPEGFATDIHRDFNSCELFTYVLKGGPGTGKSTLMKKIAATLPDAELYFCSSDPDSLDAVISRQKGIMVIDGTAPHVFDPVYAGVCQRVINLGEFWDTEKLLLNKQEIIALTNENKSLHARAKRYLKAASGLYSDIFSLGEAAINRRKLDSYSERICAKLIPKSSESKQGSVLHRRISSITPKGLITQESAFADCKTYYIDDALLAVTDRLLKAISVYAVNKGHDVIVSTNPILPDSVYDHVVIPSLNLAFSAKHIAESQRINSLRFYNSGIIKEKRKRYRFASAAGAELIKETANVLSKAKAVHDDLESYYIGAMDFEKLNEFAQTVIKEIELK